MVYRWGMNIMPYMKGMGGSPLWQSLSLSTNVFNYREQNKIIHMV